MAAAKEAVTDENDERPGAVEMCGTKVVFSRWTLAGNGQAFKMSF